jgi:hypothetical protein
MSPRSPQPSRRLPSYGGEGGFGETVKPGPSLGIKLILGGLAMFCFAGQAGYYYGSGEPWSALWAWDIAALLIGGGVIGGLARLNGAGLLIAALGLPFWVLDLMSSEPFILTSLLTRIFAPGIAIAAVRWLGLPRPSASTAFVVAAALTALALQTTPEEANINFAHGPVPGLMPWQSQDWYHYAFLGGIAAVSLLFLQFAFRWAFEQIGWLKDVET